jgi:subtilisin family serine protease
MYPPPGNQLSELSVGVWGTEPHSYLRTDEVNKEDIMSMIDFLSEEYIDFTVVYNASARQLIRDNPYVEICKVLEGGYAVIYVPMANLAEFFDAAGGDLPTFLPVIQGLMGIIDLEASGIPEVQSQSYLDLQGQGVLLGFVDTGIDYTSDAFRYEDGSTRIVSIWDQTIHGNPPEGYCYGTEYTQYDINAALYSEYPYSAVPHRDTVGHGTFMASVAGGRENDNTIGAAPAAEFIIVKLTAARIFHRNYFMVPEHQENAYSSGDVMMGLDYLVNKAVELNRPIAISLGLGSNFTGHHGYLVYERYLSNIAAQRDVFVAAAAGNESNAKHHMTANVTDGGSANIEIYSGENEPGFGITIWTYIQDRVSVSVTSPLGETVNRVVPAPGLIKETRLRLENTTVVVEYYYPLTITGGQISVVRFRDPTPGMWTVTVYGDHILNGAFHAWLPITGFVGPETIFLLPNPYHTVTSPATALCSTTCGAYSAINKSLYISSSWGPDRFLTQLPDLVAPGVNVIGVYPWGHGSMSGTSAAAAITAGAGALMLQWGGMNNISLNSINIRAYLIYGCTRRPGFTYPNYQWGYGELNLIRAFEFMREIP